jgi:hypothetical protein
MNLKSTQTNEVAPVIFLSPERNNSRTDAGKGLSAESLAFVLSGPSVSASATQLPGAQSQALLSRIDYLKDQLDKIMVDFPPFSRLGVTRGSI